jgi:hypothetical protein
VTPTGPATATGARFEIEIPSVEGPEAFAAVLDEARRLDVPVARVSQGSGIDLLTDGDLGAIVELERESGVEACLWAGTRASWTTGLSSAPAPATVVGALGVSAAIDQVHRAVRFGVRSVIVADLGLLARLGTLRSDGALPADLRLKLSVFAGVRNPEMLLVCERLGANSVNVPSDLTVGQLAELRERAAVTLDIYVEAPDDIGGQLRYDEAAEIVRAATPVYLKFGLRNAPALYPVGGHLDAVAIATARARVRRARHCLDRLALAAA